MRRKRDMEDEFIMWAALSVVSVIILIYLALVVILDIYRRFK